MRVFSFMPFLFKYCTAVGYYCAREGLKYGMGIITNYLVLSVPWLGLTEIAVCWNWKNTLLVSMSSTGQKQCEWVVMDHPLVQSQDPMSYYSPAMKKQNIPLDTMHMPEF